MYPDLHNFCATDLSAFYFDVRKDAIYCDRPDSLRRRAARTVLDHLHRCLTTWLAPVLCFTAEEAWCARFGEDSSVHLELFPTIPAEWRDDALAAKWETIREVRRRLTTAIEAQRAAGLIKSSLQAGLAFAPEGDLAGFLSSDQWAEIAIVSSVVVSSVALASDKAEPAVVVTVAAGEKCARCWKVLEEVGDNACHPTLCLRCVDAVEFRLVCQEVG